MTVSNRYQVDVANYERYIADPIREDQLAHAGVVLINSMPKSGTYWMMTMLMHLLNIDDHSRIRLLHVNDLQLEEQSFGSVLGTVVVVRDMRDVVVSWFYETARSDARAGFTSQRYPDTTTFYFEHLIGFLRCSPRYNYGHLDSWLDLVSARGYPLVRYEDMVSDTAAALRKILKFWKVTLPDVAVDATAQQFTFSKLRASASHNVGPFEQLVRHGHLRRGRVGDWQQELSSGVVADIEHRFKEYQSRLGYDDCFKTIK